MSCLSSRSKATPNLSLPWWSSHLPGMQAKGDEMSSVQGELLEGQTNEKLLCRKGARDHEEEMSI